jgi:hypothetical protein
MTPAEEAILKLASEHPGSKLKGADIGFAYDTARHAVARLRSKGLLYPAIPAWAVLTPDWAEAFASWEAPTTLKLAGTLIIDKLKSLDGHDEQRMLLDTIEARLTPAYGAMRAMREEGVLYNWDALVVTDKGAAEAETFAFDVKPHRWRGDDAPK